MSQPLVTVPTMTHASLNPTRRRSHRHPWLILALTAVFGPACTATTNSDTSLPRTSDPVTTTTRTSPPTTRPAPPTTQRPTTTTTIPIIDSGTYIVGTEIQPGQYRVAGYWARLDSDFDIIRNDGVYDDRSLSYVEIQPTDAYFELSGEAIALADLSVYDPVGLGAKGGTYLVGVDIAPGRYRVEDETFAYAARLACDGDIIRNAGNEGNVIIEIQPSDCLFSYTGSISRLD